MSMNRAYSLLTIKAMDEDKREIEGIATTPSPDRTGDIVESKGAEFKLPIPLLWQHKSDKPIGHVTSARVTAAGIVIKAKLAKIDEPGLLKDRLDEAWQSIKSGLVGGLSIGFTPLESSRIEGTYSYRFVKWLWLELSAVTVPANGEATITAIKSIDTRQRAASGNQKAGSTSPGVTGPCATSRTKGDGKMDIKQKLADLEADFSTAKATMNAIVAKAQADGRDIDSFDEEEAEQYDTARNEKKALSLAIERTSDLLESSSAANPVGTVKSARDASTLRGGGRIEVKGDNLPKGTAFTRYAMALAKSKGNLMQAAEIAKQWTDTPQVERIIKTAVAAGTTTDADWAGPLVEYNTMTGEFVELLRPATIIGRIPGLRQVPFNISMPRQTTGSSVGWVGEGKAKPLSAGAFDTVTLRWAKAAGIVVLTNELVRFSSPSAEAVVRSDLIGAMAQFLDRQFVDPNVAEVSNVSPASVTNGVTPIVASGTTADHVRDDFRAMFNAFLTANLSVAGAVIVMTEQLALSLHMMVNALGQPEFPGMTPNGGMLFGLPVVTSENAQATEDPGSPPEYQAGGLIMLVKASEIMLADDGQVMLDSSSEASVQMDTEPDEPTSASTVLVSLWQRNMIGLKAERWINWKKRRAAAVQYITGANYGGA